MKAFITKKEASRYNVYSVGYCRLQQLLKDKRPQFYHSGVYGWNCDYYVTPFDFVICTMKPTANDFITTCALAAAYVICACAALLWVILLIAKVI